ncbi:hypothetical protein DEJ16_06880 [Curtobacterium sp. MCJR17_055]|uniref:hypothetical protein n=1 Tax=unclassified Curtobacterium TaxID=257496 RepID=UPI000D912F4D|nr:MULTISPECIES: hypothetical protein [unclassified Curtobacterium]PYY38029.1 hypothetical protein DEI87_02635 [Curtobacterium sp. MCBD17_029]PYY57054.1 hypothetical protein DEJ16_06880 [Curtobacterium sp. MCJR17_055]PYY62030.1 hypothetical protein DEJ26_00645 [Curtobacterium sp. MCPF17_015]
MQVQLVVLALKDLFPVQLSGDGAFVEVLPSREQMLRSSGAEETVASEGGDADAVADTESRAVLAGEGLVELLHCELAVAGVEDESGDVVSAVEERVDEGDAVLAGACWACRGSQRG